tara:strand:- start:349 stop:678 length:330 start_codon:yes stop_codon:yes gene_type:complete
MILSNFAGLVSINQKHCHLLRYNASLISVAVSQAKNFLSANVSSKCFQDFFGERYFGGTLDQRRVNDPHALAPLVFQRLQALARAITFTQHSAQQVFRTVQLRLMAGAW